MKTLLMIAAMIGISYSGIAQHTSTKHKSSTKHAKTSTKTVAAKECKTCFTASNVSMGGREATWNRLLSCSKAKRIAAKKHAPATVAVNTETRVIQPSNLCYSYKKDNIRVTECPDLMSAPGELEKISEGTYGGYYPKAGTIATVNPLMAPQSPNVSHYRGPAPESGNFPAPTPPPSVR